MKNRKTIIVAFLLVAALCLGIGYAAINDTLTINGVANISTDAAITEFDEDIYFTGVTNNSDCIATVVDGEGNVVNEYETAKSDLAKIEINNTLGVQGDTATATFKVKNAGNSTATVAVTAPGSDNFATKTDKVSYSIAAGEEIDITITITLRYTVDTESITNEAFVITLSASSAD